jgi:hypothetical protein
VAPASAGDDTGQTIPKRGTVTRQDVMNSKGRATLTLPGQRPAATPAPEDPQP